MKTNKITLKSDKNHSAFPRIVTVRVKDGRLSRRQVRRVQRVLHTLRRTELGHTNTDAVVGVVLSDGTAEVYHRDELVAKLVAEVSRRGGETGIDHSPCQGCSASQTQWRELEIDDAGVSEGRMVVLLKAEGWRYYSRRFGARPAGVAYLAGFDDNGAWAVRVPRTMETTEEAVEWITPAAVKKARDTGRRVLRQGDVYAVETNRTHEAACDAEIGDHCWYTKARVLIHNDNERPHAPLSVPFRCRFVTQRGYEMGRGSGQGAAD